MIFARHEETGFSFVHRQPMTPEEIALATEAIEGCPVEAIGRDGAAAT
jgi:ferredoxin